MERDPRGGEAKKASPGYIPSESEIDDLLWTTHGINPRRQKEYKPLTKDDIQNMSLEEMNASGGTWSRLSAAQACCKRSDNLHAKMEMGMQYKEEHAEAQHDQEELRKRLAKHFTDKSAKKQKQAEK